MGYTSGFRGSGIPSIYIDGMSQTPWWGVPLVAGIFALGGVLVASLVTMQIERQKRLREDRQRWYADRRRAYVELLSAYLTYLQGIKGRRDLKFLEYAAIVANPLIEVRMLASTDVRDAALAVNRCYERLHDAVNNTAGKNAATERVPAILDDLSTSIHKFESAIRKELGIDGIG
jgi:hypothetical protein